MSLNQRWARSALGLGLRTLNAPWLLVSNHFDCVCIERNVSMCVVEIGKRDYLSSDFRCVCECVREDTTLDTIKCWCSTMTYSRIDQIDILHTVGYSWICWKSKFFGHFSSSHHHSQFFDSNEIRNARCVDDVDDDYAEPRYAEVWAVSAEHAMKLFIVSVEIKIFIFNKKNMCYYVGRSVADHVVINEIW